MPSGAGQARERYELAGRSDHKSATSVVRRASDLDDTPVAIKFMARRDQFDCEVNARRGLNHRYVMGILATSDGVGADLFAKAAAKLGYGSYGVVMPEGDRNLTVVMLQERLTVAEIAKTMQQLAACLEHLHTVGKRIHGDFKPLNAMRMATNEWKLIDLDASARIGVGVPPSQHARGARTQSSLRTAHAANAGARFAAKSGAGSRAPPIPQARQARASARPLMARRPPQLCRGRGQEGRLKGRSAQFAQPRLKGRSAQPRLKGRSAHGRRRPTVAPTA